MMQPNRSPELNESTLASEGKAGNYDRGKVLERLNVRSLPTLRSLDYVELHCLALLKALETV